MGENTLVRDCCNAFVNTTKLPPFKSGNLSGLSFAVKDNIFTGGVRTTACSRILQDFIPDYDAFIVKQIRLSGGEIIGKTNNHEFAVGTTNTSSIFGAVRNPCSSDCISGGSSGGSAAAVASGAVDIGIGTDTGGSVRIPSALCGVAGFKPSTGLIPTEGVIPLSRTMDAIGIIAKDVASIRTVFESVLPQNSRAIVRPEKDIKSLGLMLFDDGPVSKKLLKKVECLAGEYEISEISIPSLEERGGSLRRKITSAEGASYHRKWLETKRDLYFPDVREVLLAGLKTGTSDYIEAWNLLKGIIKEYDAVFSRIGAILSPTTKTVAPKISDVIGRELRFRDSLLGNTELFNAVFAPSVSINACEMDGLPAGLMISGSRNDDFAVLRLAETIGKKLKNL
ncbi:MAG: amidase [Thermoplasmata archaeon]|nr:amidase [Candidatus Sysuiplasma jiujiangense]